MAELADVPDLGSGVYDVQVQVLSSALKREPRNPRVCKNTRIPGFSVRVEMQVPWVLKEKSCQETEFSLNSFSLSMNMIRKATNKRKEHPKIAFS